MTRRTAAFTQADMTRAMRAAKACGLPVTGVRIRPDGEIILIMTAPPDDSRTNEWDTVK